MKNKIKCLEMMGYEVLIRETTNDVLVMFETSKGYRCYVNIFREEMEKDFIVEQIVRSINDMLYRDL